MGSPVNYNNSMFVAPKLHRTPDLVERNLLGDAYLTELGRHLYELNINGAEYTEFEEKEVSSKIGLGVFTNPLCRAKGWKKLIEYVMQVDVVAARNIFNEAKERGVFTVEQKNSKSPSARKINGFLKKLQNFFDRENENHFAGLVEEYEKEMNRSETPASPELETQLKLLALIERKA